MAIFGGFIPLLLLGCLVWIIVRAMSGNRPRAGSTDPQHPEPRPVDTAAEVRRVVLYGLLFGAVMLFASGLTSTLSQLAEGGSFASDRAATVARSLAFLIVGTPALVLLGRYALRQLDEHESERDSGVWTMYLNLTLAVSFGVAWFQAHALLRALANEHTVHRSATVAVLVWGAIWMAHWSWLRPRFGIHGDFHLAAGSVAGLVVTLVGAVGLFQRAGDLLIDNSLDSTVSASSDRAGGPTTWSWMITFGLAVAVWSFFWLARYRRAPRTQLWDTVVLFPGTLAGLIMTVVSSTWALYLVLVWFLGDPFDTLAREHFAAIPGLLGACLVGGASWWHHHLVLDERPGAGAHQREDPVRLRDYLIAGASLVTAIAGLTTLLVALLESISMTVVAGQTGIANRVLLAVTLLGVGVPLWWHTWSGIGRIIDDGDVDEQRSPIRRIYLLGLFGVGSVVAVVSLLGALTGALRDLIEGTVGWATLDQNRLGIALVLAVTGAAWYHFNVFRRDRDALQPPPPVVGQTPPSPLTRLVVVAPPEATLADQLVSTGLSVTSLTRTDLDVGEPSSVHLDRQGLDELMRRIEALETTDALVVLGSHGIEVIPYRTAFTQAR